MRCLCGTDTPHPQNGRTYKGSNTLLFGFLTIPEAAILAFAHWGREVLEPYSDRQEALIHLIVQSY